MTGISSQMTMSVDLNVNVYTGEILDKDEFKLFTNCKGKPTEKFM